MKYMLLWLPALALSFAVVSCATTPPLAVKQFYLRDQKLGNVDDSMIRSEKLLRLYGAISIEQQRQKLGQYYTILWHDAAGVNQGPAEILFEYKQGKSASAIKHHASSFDSAATEGKTEFSVTGDNYFNNGKVIAWKAYLKRAGKVLHTEQSYLWE